MDKLKIKSEDLDKLQSEILAAISASNKRICAQMSSVTKITVDRLSGSGQHVITSHVGA